MSCFFYANTSKKISNRANIIFTIFVYLIDYLIVKIKLILLKHENINTKKTYIFEEN